MKSKFLNKYFTKFQSKCNRFEFRIERQKNFFKSEQRWAFEYIYTHPNGKKVSLVGVVTDISTKRCHFTLWWSINSIAKRTLRWIYICLPLLLCSRTPSQMKEMSSTGIAYFCFWCFDGFGDPGVQVSYRQWMSNLGMVIGVARMIISDTFLAFVIPFIAQALVSDDKCVFKWHLVNKR